MFNYTVYYDEDSYSNWDPCSLEYAVTAIEELGGYDYAEIETSISGVIVWENGTWIIPREEAEALAEQEEQDKRAAEAAAEAERKAEAATVGDEIDKENISFIMSIAIKHPARDNGAQRTADEIRDYEGWEKQPWSYKATEADVTDVKSGRHYHIDMWRGNRKITRTLLK